MKYFIAILTLGVIFLLGIFFEFPLWILIVVNLFLFTILLIWELSVFTHNFKSDITLKSYRKSLNLSKYIGMIPFVFSFLFEKENWNNSSTFEFSMMLFLIIILSADIITYIVYKLRHPVTIFIDNDNLIFNNCWQKKRNLKDLNYIGIPSMTGELELGFIKKEDVRIPFREYDKKQFRHFLEILVEKSEHNVYLTEKVQKKFPATLLKHAR
ncbi:hypothetical protein [Kordia sp.]|uniref:hypothetical protein n=1 Tax=Kordia sp. TaxID=1965332 RepID=UPI003D6B3057